MLNQEIAKILYDIADRFQIQGVAFKPYAYRKAADVLVSTKEDIVDIYKNGGLKALEDMPGIGKNIALKIEEYIKTGKIKYYEKLKKELPVDIEKLTRIEGVGPMAVKTFYEELKIKNIKDLEKAAKGHKIAPLFGFGDKKEKLILEGIEFLKKDEGRVPLGDALFEAERIVSELTNCRSVKKISFAGSLRRMKETIGDIDILVGSNEPEKVMDFFVGLNGIEKVWGKGKTKSSVRMKEGFNVDLRVVSLSSFGSALQYFTGSRDHNIDLRRRAISLKMKVNEYGVFKKDRKIAGEKEEDIYSVLGIDWIAPELREGRGEIELAENKKLPKIIELKDIKGDLHCHTDWSGGKHSIKEMAEEAKKLNYSYIGIADHTKYLKVENGLDEKELRAQRKEIDKLNSKNIGIKILQGCEANILKDGSIDIKDSALAELNYVIAGIHSHFKMTKKEMTERLIKAMRNPFVDIVSHPTGRIIGKREGYDLDMDRIFSVAKETGTILEINGHPKRLDLSDDNIKRAIDMGVKMVVNSDAHNKDDLTLIKFGVAQARRGWATKKDVLNTGTFKRKDK